MDKDTLRFIDKIYKDLYKSPEVLKHSSGNETEKFKNLEEYMNKLESVHERASQSKERIKTIKRMYYDKYVIKEEDIPDSYYELQKRLALERGYGHITINADQKKQLQDEVIKNQKNSLDTWLDYLISEDAKHYPFWAKYWAFQGMLKMGIYDKENGTFSKRTDDTVAPFIDLNREALAKSIDLVIKTLGKEKIEDRDLEIIVKSGSFPKIYTYTLKKILSDNKNIIKRDEGVWVKYNQGSDHMPLVRSLQGYNTGWCTAGESTAKNQLNNGDFYVYYTLNEKNEYKVPRIAIRMEGNRIGEIRGIAPNQNIEPNMEKVVEEKIKDFPDKEKYYKKVDDMKRLTEIYDRYFKTKMLSKSDLTFLYEVEGKINGFGYQKDPRIKEILDDRNEKEDFSIIFDCSKDRIATSKDELNEKTLCYVGNLYLHDLEKKYGKKIKLPEYVIGNLNLVGLDSIFGIKFPKYVKGDLKLSDLSEAENLKLPVRVGGSLNLENLTKARKLMLPEYVGCDLDLSSFTQTVGYKLPKEIGNDLKMNGVKELRNIEFPKTVGGDLQLFWLKTARDLVLPEHVGGSVYISDLIEAYNVKFPVTVGWSLELDNITVADDLVLPKVITRNLDMNMLKSAKNLVLPESVACLYMGKLESVEGITLPKVVTSYMYIPAVKTLKDITFLEEVGHLRMDGLKTAENVVFPKKSGGNFEAPSLISAKDVTFPEEVLGEMSLNSLQTIENTTFPTIVHLSLVMDSIKKLSDTKLPERIKGNLNLKSLEEAENVVFPKVIDSNFSLCSLTKAQNVEFPISVGHTLDMSKLKKIEKLEMEGATFNIYLKSLEEVSDKLVFPKTVDNLFLDSLVKADNIVFPSSVDSLYLKNLKELEKLVLEGSSLKIYLNSLEKVGTLILPNYVYSLELNSLTTYENLVLPETAGNVFVKNAQVLEDFEAKGIRLPKMSGLVYTQDFLDDMENLRKEINESIASNKKKID